MRRNKTQREKDKHEIAALYCAGIIQATIAERLGLTQQTVSNDLKAIRNDWLASSLRDFDELKAEQLAKLDYVETQAHAPDPGG